ncbi:hypothetical protein COCC4DRAFT_57365 [Bipolaris maydis ATCC 48331]|uniref:Uncharacterized protein n=2 Tax=Cochliobolus heterostrophus TaxID=5016 RepID=M2UUR9_COCH5|nr:uncharacterized protein COCC4DRAFT_57365 [Bipolaris maydis ATCC 48331]EMD91613.1 hypothetical protein COCHEDRAFT_1101496 [Bipolaris maydis C5]ENI08630.1 hypothetical protein COCC4DRAFT_57365 [Bipolaris maydis ATCC 48331]
MHRRCNTIRSRAGAGRWTRPKGEGLERIGAGRGRETVVGCVHGCARQRQTSCLGDGQGRGDAMTCARELHG